MIRVAALAALMGWHASARAQTTFDSVVVESARISVVDGVVVGSDTVVIRMGDETATGARFKLYPDRGVLVLEDGRWDRGDSVLNFARAELDLGDLTGVVLDGRLEDRDGRWVVESQTMRLLSSDRLTGTNVRVSACECDRPPWSVTARRVRVRVDDAATFTGGWLRVCEIPVLPIPVGMGPLKARRTGLLLPRTGWGRDGLVVSQPAVLVLGPHADLTVEPEWRQETAGRMLSEFRYALSDGAEGGSEEGGVLRTAVGPEEWGDPLRGAVEMRHGWAPGHLRTGVDGQWVSDPRYLADYGGDFLVRSAPWSESLAVAGVGPLRIESDTFHADGPVDQRPLAGVVSVTGQKVGPVVAGGSVRADLTSTDSTSTTAFRSAPSSDALHRVAGAAQLESGRTLGPTRVEARAEGRTVRWMSDDPWSEGRLGGRWVLSLWGDAGRVRHLADAGLEARVAGVLGQPEIRLPEDMPAPAWSVGPVMDSRWLSARGVPVSASLAAPWTPDGLRPAGAARARWNNWTLRLQGDADLQDGRVAWDDGVLRMSVGGARFAQLAQASGEAAWTLPGVLSEWRPGWRALVDIVGEEVLSQGPSVAFSSRCNCLELAAGATWSADRTVPDLMFQVDIR